MPEKTLGEHYRAKDITEDELAEAVAAYLKKPEAGERKVGALKLDIAAAIRAHPF